MLRFLTTYRRLPPHERSVVRAALWQLPRAAIALRLKTWVPNSPVAFFATGGWDSLPTSARRSNLPLVAQSASPARIGLLVAAVARHCFPRSRCLTRSLALARILKGYGFAAELRLGVRKSADFEAHAWVEVDGIALLDSAGELANYVALAASTTSVKSS